MSKNFFARESRGAFDFATLKIVLSALAITLASLMGGAASVATEELKEISSCPVPFSQEYCSGEKNKNTCEMSRPNILPTTLINPFLNDSVTPYCSKSSFKAREENES